MKSRVLTVAVIAFIAGVGTTIVCSQRSVISASAVHAQEKPTRPPDDLATLRAEIERLKQVVPDQAHAMQDVDYHFTNLWFAGQHGNWPLSQFYFNETKSHLRWAVRIIPVRKDKQGREILLEKILEAFENTPLAQLEGAIKAEDCTKFVAAYEFTLTTCYSCHKASDKPYLRPHIPKHPATKIMNFDPHAKWPQ
jgi:hypothetical protein